MIRRIGRFRTRAFVRARCSESHPPVAGAGIRGIRCPDHPYRFIAPSAGPLAAPCSHGFGGTTTRSVPPCLARDAHRDAHLWRDPLRGVGAIGGGKQSASAPAALHGLGLDPSPFLEAASGLLLRPAIRRDLSRPRSRHLTTSREPRDEDLATSRLPSVGEGPTTRWVGGSAVLVVVRDADVWRLINHADDWHHRSVFHCNLRSKSHDEGLALSRPPIITWV